MANPNEPHPTSLPSQPPTLTRRNPQPNPTPNDASPTTSTKTKEAPPPIWWSNAIFFIGMHLLALYGSHTLSPLSHIHPYTLVLCILSWQTATFGITIGYHRLWSHRAFVASQGLRWVLAGMGCLGFQGSIRWWVLRHRIHHRWTDTDDDPYNSSRGLFFSHMGWIFRKPKYAKMALIERADLDADRVVRFQHKHYIPLTLFLGLVLPTCLGTLWNDPLGGFIYGGVVARLLIWHMTFFINSLAHYLGEQEYSREITARANFLLAVFTGGRRIIIFITSVQDYRNGPSALDWDPTKWIIYLLYTYTPLITKLYATSEEEIQAARKHVRLHGHAAYPGNEDGEGEDSGYGSSEGWEDTPARRKVPEWKRDEVPAKVAALGSGSGVGTPVVLVIEGWAVDVTAWAPEHPGGVSILRRFAVKPENKGEGKVDAVDATEAFYGGLNWHQWPARRKMRGFRIAKVV